MRRASYIIIAVISLACFFSCGKEKTRTIVETTQGDSVDGNRRTYETSDGYTIVDTLGVGPTNEKVTYYDREKRIVAVAGMASEVVDYNFVKVLYYEDGAVRGYLSAISVESLSDSLETECDK